MGPKIRKFKKKPVEVEAMKFVDNDTAQEILDWVGLTTPIQVAIDAESGLAKRLYIATLEGEMAADLGDWIIKGVAGEFYPCKDEIFWASYTETTYDA